MKIFSDPAMAAIIAGTAIAVGAVQITPPGAGTVIRVWEGYAPFDLLGDAILFNPLGGRGFAQNTSNAIGGVAQGMTLTLSGIEDAALALLDPGEAQSASIVVYRAIFDGAGKNLLDVQVFDRGRGDTLETVETRGGQSALNLAVESAARSLGRRGSRMRADYDQRLINASDGYFKATAYAGEKKLYWGGKKPSLAAGSLSPPIGNYGT